MAKDSQLNIALNQELIKKFKIECIKRNRPIKEVIEELVKIFLKREK